METKDNQQLRDGITILTVMGTDSVEKKRKEEEIEKKTNRSRDDRLAVSPTHEDIKAPTHKGRCKDICQHHRQQNKVTQTACR